MPVGADYLCGKRIKYMNYESAQFAVRRQRYLRTLQVFHCPECQRYHIEKLKRKYG